VKKPRRAATVDERIYRAIFGGRRPLAWTRNIWPDLKPEIIAAICRARTTHGVASANNKETK